MVIAHQQDFWLQQESESDLVTYYERKEGIYNDVIYYSKTFDSTHTSYTKDLSQDCLTAKPSSSVNKFDIVNYDCNKQAIAICQMFEDENVELTTEPPLPPIPIFVQNYTTELPNFDCYLSDTTSSEVDSKRDKREDSLSGGNLSASSNSSNNQTKTEKLALLLDPNKEYERNKNYEEAKAKFKSDFGEMDLSISYPYFFELLWYSQIPCSDVKMLTSGYRDEKSFLKRCYWEEIEVDCNSIFRMRPTDRGMCCTFNAAHLEETLRDGNFSQIVKKLQYQDDQRAYKELVDTNLTSKSKHKSIIGKPGRSKGLMVFLDAHTDKISSGTVFDEFRGFTTVVDGRDQFPMTFQKSFLIQPGYENSISLSAVDVMAEEDLRTIPPEKRRCYFADENPLQLHINYSFSNCLLECSLNYTINAMRYSNNSDGGNCASNVYASNHTTNGTKFSNHSDDVFCDEDADVCVPWFYPVLDIKKGFCDPWQTKEFLRHMAEIPIGKCKYCLPDCNSPIYDASTSTAPIRFCDHTNLGVSNLCTLDSSTSSMNPSLISEPIKNEFWQNMGGELPEFATPTLKNLPSKRLRVRSDVKAQNLVLKSALKKASDYNAFKQDIALVNFYFEQAYVQQYKRQHSLKMADYVAQVGGLFSFAFGMSLISIFEVIWHFFLQPIINMFK